MNAGRTAQKARVSVVIPTIGRDSLRTAVRGVANQAVATEIIVVLDVPEKHENVAAMLIDIPHRLVLTPGKVGGGRARNLGTAHASGTHIAFLDDDDTWAPDKLELQLDALENSDDPASTVCMTATRFVRSTKHGNSSTVLPKQFYCAEERIGDYLVQRRDLRYGRTFMQTSSVLARAELIRLFPWGENVRKHQDWDLFCRMFSFGSGLRVLHLSAPLVTVYQDSAESVSGRADWGASAEWYRAHYRDLSSRGRADFIWTQILRSSLRQRSLPGLRFFLSHLTSGLPHAPAMIIGLLGLVRR